MLVNHCELWEAGCCGYCCSLHREFPGHGVGLILCCPFAFLPHLALEEMNSQLG